MSGFDMYGPFAIARNQRACAADQSGVWMAANQLARGLPGAIGCYVFAVQQGERITPWYVGETLEDFAGAVFQPVRVSIFDRCMVNSAGQPVLFLFPLCTANRRNFSTARRTGGEAVRWLEAALMGLMLGNSAAMRSVDGMRLVGTVAVPEHLMPARMGWVGLRGLGVGG